MSAKSPVTAQEITELTGLTQKAWFGLLSFLAFFLVVILSTTDSDFLVGSKQTQIPIIGIAVPTERFFFLAPIVGSVLYAYLHLYCIKLWNAVREADASVLATQRPTSLVADIAYFLRPDAHSRGGNIGTLAAALLIWVAHPALLTVAIARSQAASRAGWLSPDEFPHLSVLVPTTVEGMTVLCLSLSLAIGAASLLGALAIKWPASPADRRRHLRPFVVIAAFAAPILVGHDFARLRTAPVSLDRQDLVGLDRNFLLAEERRQAFRKDWCATQGVKKTLCGNVPARVVSDAEMIEKNRNEWCGGSGATLVAEIGCKAFFQDLDAAFYAEWNAARRAELARLPQLDLDGRQLAGITAAGAKFLNARMEQATLAGSNLKGANFEGADLLGARLEAAVGQYATFDRANLTNAHFENANLASANLEGADLIGAQLQGANLVDANLSGADLTDADLTGANLTNARLRQAKLVRTKLNGTILTGADLLNVTLGAYQIAEATGDDQTKLPDVEATELPLQVATCWKVFPAAVDRVMATFPDTDLGRHLRANLNNRICRGDQEPELVPALEAPAEPQPPAPTLSAYGAEPAVPADKRAIFYELMPRPRPSASIVTVSAP